MMRTLITVFLKEVLDNVRDRRTLASALIMGPLFGPMLFAFVINLSIERSLDDIERVTELPVIGREHAPNLLRYLESRNIDIVGGPADRDAALDAVGTGKHDVVLYIPPEFAEQFTASRPARVELITDQSNSQADREARRVRTALRTYSQELVSIRLTARGVSPLALRPLNIDEVDMSTPSGRSAILLGMMSYFFIFALLMGGMYLAIDTTAGERERGSLEPLLALPVTRNQLLLGKVAATCVFMAVSLGLSLGSFFIALKFMPLDELGMTPNFGPLTVGAAFLVLSPFILLGAAVMTLVASFTKSYREAQTWLSVVLLAPTLPILIVSILTLRPRLEFMFVPSLSQHLLLIDMGQSRLIAQHGRSGHNDNYYVPVLRATASQRLQGLAGLPRRGLADHQAPSSPAPGHRPAALDREARGPDTARRPAAGGVLRLHLRVHTSRPEEGRRHRPDPVDRLQDRPETQCGTCRGDRPVVGRDDRRAPVSGAAGAHRQ
jgi:sodium transport system permease protein